MLRWICAVVALSLVGAPAMAQTSKKKSPTKTEAKAEEKKKKPDPEPEEEPEPKPRKKRAPPPEEDEQDEKQEKDKKEAKEAPTHGKIRPGLSLLLGPALSTSNSEGKLTPLPFASLALSLDGALSGAWYFRLEPSLGYLRRKSTVNVVRKVDASSYPTVKINTEDLVNRVTAIDFTVRAMAGYDYTKDLTGRAGLLFGISTASTDTSDCSSDNRSTGAIYGAHLTPIAMRIPLGSKWAEVGLSAELRSQKLPRCDVPLKGDFQVNAGEVATFKPKKVETQFTSVAVALQGAIFF